MNKIYSLVVVSILLVCLNTSYSQSTTNIDTVFLENLSNDTIEICLGDSVYLIGGMQGLDYVNSNFNNSSLDSGWTSNVTAIWSNPCMPTTLPASGNVCWFGTNVFPRELITNSFNLTMGGCFLEWDMKYGANQNVTNCESPDLPDEGVHLMYSTSGGAPWTQFPGIDQAPVGVYGNSNYINGTGGYWTPINGNAAIGPYYTWNHYKTLLPAAAFSANTKIRWFQDIASGNNFDHWGIDNVVFACHPASSPFMWNNGSPSIVVSPSITQWYVASKLDTTQNPNVLIYDSVLIVVHQIPLTPTISISGDSLYSSSAYGNQWYLNGNPIIAAMNTYYIATANGNYQLVVSNTFECHSDTSNTIAINSLGINEIASKDEFILQPNPAEDYFSIQSNEKISQLQIYDMSGNSIQSFLKPLQNNKYNIKDLVKGVYFVKIYSGNKISVLKLIKS